MDRLIWNFIFLRPGVIVNTWCSLSLSQCPHNVHKLDGYMCDAGQVKSGYFLICSHWIFLKIHWNTFLFLPALSCPSSSFQLLSFGSNLPPQGRCYGGRCKTRDGQCRALWGYGASGTRFLPFFPPVAFTILNISWLWAKTTCENKSNSQFFRLSGQILLREAELWGNGEGKLWPRLQRSGMDSVQQAVS